MVGTGHCDVYGCSNDRRYSSKYVVATARIHIERVMGRLKEFRLLDHTLPLNLVGLIDDIWIIAAAITNLQPPLVKRK